MDLKAVIYLSERIGAYMYLINTLCYYKVYYFN